MMEEKLKTNLDLITNLMNYSPRGGLNQAFIICAIESYCKGVLAQPEVSVEEAKASFISPEAWRDCANDNLKRINEFYEREAEKRNSR
jgi:hypothetical protein